MQSNPTVTPASSIPVPDIDIDEPVAVIPMASVAPLDGPPDGERIHTFALAPASEVSTGRALGAMRERVRNKPFTFLIAAFSFGYVLARAMR